MNQPCPKHGTREKPATHLWKDCFIMREYRNSNFFRIIMGRTAAQDPALTVRVMVAAGLIPVSRVKAIKEVLINSLVRESAAAIWLSKYSEAIE